MSGRNSSMNVDLAKEAPPPKPPVSNSALSKPSGASFKLDIQKPIYERDYGKKDVEKIPQTEMELHKGWIENLTNEERTMKESLKQCIHGGFTKDPARAQEIYNFSFAESDKGSIAPSSPGWKQGVSINDTMKKKYGWQPKGLLGVKELKK